MTLRNQVLSAFLAVILSLPLAGTIRSEERPREECSLCGMWVDEHLHTRLVVGLRDGSSHSFCSLTCAAELLKQRHRDVSSVQVADYPTGVLVDARRVKYVVGSDLPPVMGLVSAAAFRSNAEASAFRKNHGGKIIRFEEAWKSLR